MFTENLVVLYKQEIYLKSLKEKYDRLKKFMNIYLKNKLFLLFFSILYLGLIGKCYVYRKSSVLYKQEIYLKSLKEKYDRLKKFMNIYLKNKLFLLFFSIIFKVNR